MPWGRAAPLGPGRDAVTRDELQVLMADGDLPCLDLLFARPAWMAHAACRGSSVNFHPERGQDTRSAMAICARCPVREECQDYALDMGEMFGVWGGTTAKERRRLIRHNGFRERDLNAS